MSTSVKRPYKLHILLIVLLLGFGFYIQSFSRGSKRIYIDPFAMNKINELNHSFEICASTCGLNSKLLKSIVYPEIIRYNHIQDRLESNGLETLYVQFGEEYADFSIGLFQMKPSFAEQVEYYSNKLLPDSVQSELCLRYREQSDLEIRKKRVSRLNDTDYQLVYLTAFTLITYKLFPEIQAYPPKDQAICIGYIYNSGFLQSQNDLQNVINKMKNKKQFSNQWNYLDHLIRFQDYYANV